MREGTPIEKELMLKNVNDISVFDFKEFQARAIDIKAGRSLVGNELDAHLNTSEEAENNRRNRQIKKTMKPIEVLLSLHCAPKKGKV